MHFALFGSYGRGNIGDEAIADGIYKMLKSVDSQAEVALFSHNQDESKLLHSQFSQIKPVIASGIRSLITQWKNGTWKNTINYLKSCDYIIIGGGGIFHDQETDQKGLSPLFIWWIRSIIFKFLGKKVLVWAVGIGPLTKYSSKFWLKGILKRANIITVRDHYSEKLAKEFTQKDIVVIPDPVWGFFSPVKSKNKPRILGINIRENKRLTKDQIIDQLYKAITKIIQEQSFSKIRFIPFALREPDDRLLMKTVKTVLAKKFQLPIEITTPQDANDAFHLVSECSYFIAMRFHSYIFALSAQIPCCLLSYSKKTDEITQYTLAEYLAKQKRARFFWQQVVNI